MPWLELTDTLMNASMMAARTWYRGPPLAKIWMLSTLCCGLMIMTRWGESSTGSLWLLTLKGRPHLHLWLCLLSLCSCSKSLDSLCFCSQTVLMNAACFLLLCHFLGSSFSTVRSPSCATMLITLTLSLTNIEPDLPLTSDLFCRVFYPWSVPACAFNWYTLCIRRVFLVHWSATRRPSFRILSCCLPALMTPSFARYPPCTCGAPCIQDMCWCVSWLFSVCCLAFWFMSIHSSRSFYFRRPGCFTTNRNHRVCVSSASVHTSSPIVGKLLMLVCSACTFLHSLRITLFLSSSFSNGPCTNEPGIEFDTSLHTPGSVWIMLATALLWSFLPLLVMLLPYAGASLSPDTMYVLAPLWIPFGNVLRWEGFSSPPLLWSSSIFPMVNTITWSASASNSTSQYPNFLIVLND